MRTELLLEMAADALGDRIAVTTADGAVSYGTLLARVQHAAAWLVRQPIENVGFVGVNSLAFPVSIFASGLAGKPFSPLNYRLPDRDLNALVARLGRSVTIVDEDMAARIVPPDGASAVARNKFLALGEPAAESTDAALSDVAILLFTSGTTGEPKAAILRHANLASYVISTVDFMGAEPDEATLISVPPYHIAGVSGVLTAVYAGRRIVQLPAFTPEAWVAAASSERVTHAMVVPTMLGRILKVLEERKESLPALRHLSYGGGRMPEPVIRRALDLLPHVDFVNAYGLTETSSTIAVLGPEDHRTAYKASDTAGRRRLASVGRPLPSVEIEIRGPDEATLPAGTAGEIWVKGEQVSGEYVGRKVIRDDGWFPTKDCGWLDEEGYLFVDGRLDDVIVRGGENISPGEVEDVLRRHPSVSDVAVIGMPDDEWGERVVAVIVATEKPSADELKAWVRERLRSSKVPQDVVFRDSLPYNDTGKLLRRSLKADLSALSTG